MPKKTTVPDGPFENVQVSMGFLNQWMVKNGSGPAIRHWQAVHIALQLVLDVLKDDDKATRG